MDEKARDTLAVNLVEDLKAMGVVKLLDHALVSDYMSLILKFIGDREIMDELYRKIVIKFYLVHGRIPGKEDGGQFTEHEMVRFAMFAALKFLERQAEVNPEFNSKRE